MDQDGKVDIFERAIWIRSSLNFPPVLKEIGSVFFSSSARNRGPEKSNLICVPIFHPLTIDLSEKIICLFYPCVYDVTRKESRSASMAVHSFNSSWYALVARYPEKAIARVLVETGRFSLADRSAERLAMARMFRESRSRSTSWCLMVLRSFSFSCGVMYVSTGCGS
jgi:hypothetical protein